MTSGKRWSVTFDGGPVGGDYECTITVHGASLWESETEALVKATLWLTRSIPQFDIEGAYVRVICRDCGWDSEDHDGNCECECKQT